MNSKKQITLPNLFKTLIFSFKIFFDFFKGFLFITKFKKAVSFFGSAREVLPEKYYFDSQELAARLSNKNFAVITGARGGIMRSANKGAHRNNGISVGIDIDLYNKKEITNQFLTSKKQFRYFFSRKTILSCASEVYIFFPGGYGTLDELFEMMTIIQTKHSEPVPIILYGKDFWDPIVNMIEEHLLKKYKTISPEDINLFVVMDSVDETEYYIDSLNIVQTRNCKHNL